MSMDIKYWIRVSKKIIIFIISLFLVYLGFKLAIFYIPFLVAFLLALLIEPIIKFFMKKTKLTRRTSAIAVFLIVISIIVGLLAWGITTLVSETSNLLAMLNGYFERAQNLIESVIQKVNVGKIQLSSQIIDMVKETISQTLGDISNWSKNILSSIVNGMKSIPKMGICVVITFLALYFIVTDKIYMLDQLEHHLPKKWVSKLGTHLRDLISSLGGYIKAEFILIIISFIISLVGLYIFKIFGLNVNYPLLVALAIGFIDALPIFGSGTVMIPWAVISSLYGDYKLAIGIISLWIIMSIVRQFLEPKIVSGKLGIHPIFTLISMYTGFKFFGIIGLLLGPIILIVLKNIYGTVIDEGIIKSMLNE
ncbi:MAG: sporulation integral membrane protein YtvI [Clostridia bacterium]|nr:sporulation integral membrane protein YtvI [Clostridia bacterium]